MKRPIQHIIETNSQRIFENLIPVEWVIREIKPDYGIDYLIEVFKSGQSTGTTFFVQLKGSEQEIKNNTFEKQFEVESLKYYASLSLPVLIVCVSTTTKQTWGIWANKLLKSITLKPQQETVKLTLGTENLISTEYFSQIEAALKIVTQSGLRMSSETDLGNILSNNIKKFIDHFYPETFALNNSYLPQHYSLNFLTDSSKHYFEVNGPFFSKQIEIDLIDIENPLLHRPIFNEDDINVSNAKILKLLAVAFARENLIGSLKLLRKLIDNNYFNTVEDAIEFDPLGTLQMSITQNLILHYNEIVKSIISKGYINVFLFIDISYFALSEKHKELFLLRIENLKYAINRCEDFPTKGTCYYNIGNIQRNLSITDEAIESYFKARKFLPDYEKRKHWWRELAGLLFINGHYKIAESFYIKSIELIEKDIPQRYSRLEKVLPNHESIVFALIADCLLFQGRFSEAKVWLDNFFKSQDAFNAEWYLKGIMADRLISLGLDNKKIDKEKSLDICEKALDLNNAQLQIVEFKKALEYNPTNALAWYNLAVAEDKEQNFQDAFYNFLSAGLFLDGDKEAQFNALIISFTQQKDYLFSLVLHFIIERHGELVLNNLSDYLMSKNVPFEVKKHIIDGITSMVKEMKKTNDSMLKKE